MILALHPGVASCSSCSRWALGLGSSQRVSVCRKSVHRKRLGWRHISNGSWSSVCRLHRPDEKGGRASKNPTACDCWLLGAIARVTFGGTRENVWLCLLDSAPTCYINIAGEEGSLCQSYAFCFSQGQCLMVILLSTCTLWWCIGRNDRLMLESWVLVLALTLRT